MEDDWQFPDGRTFSEIVGVPNIDDTDLFDDSASALESWEQIGDVGDGAEAASVCDSDVNEALKRSLYRRNRCI